MITGLSVQKILWGGSLKCPKKILKKWDISRVLNIQKWGIPRKKHVIVFEMGKPKMNMIDFRTFQYIIHMLFGAFQGTSRI